jgi:lipopolysaccharide biosynthesis glycosyltransferase
MNIVYCLSPDWLKYLPVQFYSLRKHNPTVDINVHIITNRVTDSLWFCDMAIRFGISIQTYQISPKFSKVYGRFTEFTMYRLLIPDLIQTDKCLYLDADTLVTGDLTTLYNKEITLLAGAIDKGITPRRKEMINFPVAWNYINAGVILMNLDELRRRELPWGTMSQKAYPCNDQDIINLTHNNDVVVLHPQYNSSMCTAKATSPVIVHYAGKKRPWVHHLPQSKYWKQAEHEYNKS